MNDIDPTKAFVAKDGYEYEDLADYLLGKKVDCRRNARVAVAHSISGVEGYDHRQAIYAIYRYHNRDGEPYAASYVRSSGLPPGAERFAPEGTCSPSPGQTSPDPVHAAT